ncbi:transcriptional regulator [Streptomyces sp. YU58]|uniref:transcriptional regulator n=1 Tax=Streptomyces sp. SX92 TaxID=3158972 RepID=UPI0027BA907A|nr:transcriptional regulator [Streptomyces coralus]WLW51290.1 helix-turn-helix domain-containing protein [Streptomyces coralus]
MSAAQDEVGEFAALLRRLKDRTDRSYGSLSRRLNMNTSTLHRYCAGEAVPLDYAPAERFAALCGATAEERLELHRLWLRAVAARQRPRAADPADTAAREPEEPEELEEPEEPESPQRTGTDANTDNAPPAVQETQHEPATATPHTPDARAESESEAVLNGRSPSAPPRRAWYRRRRIAVAAAVAGAVLVTLGSLSALPADRPSTEARVRESDEPFRLPTTPPDASGTPSGTPNSPSPGTRSPSAPEGTAGASGKPSAPPGEGRGSSEGPGGKAPGGTGTPLTWSANSHVWNQGCGHDYVITKPPAEVPPPPAAQDAGQWAAAEGAVHGKETQVQITVQGRDSTAVVLDALRVRVVGRAAPVQGSSYAMDQGCGGAISPRYFAVDLDKDRPIAHSVAGGDEEGPIPAIRMPYRVSAEDPEVLLVTATTTACDCSWYLELDWSSQGRKGTVRIDDRGRPFRTSSIKGLPRYWYATDEAGSRAWVPYDS